MELKVGDRIKIKSWYEMVEVYGVDEDGDIKLPDNYYWSNYADSKLPDNREVIISDFNNFYDFHFITEDDEECYLFGSMVKEIVSSNTDLFQKYFDKGLEYYGTLRIEPDWIAKQANKYAKECLKYVGV